MTGQATTDNLWAWIDEESDSEPFETIDPRMVAAVMVVHNAGEWLPRQLRALSALNPRPGILIAVDNGSTDESGRLLEQARAAGFISSVIRGNPDFGLGAAVAAALPPHAPWIWLLHDDSAPHPDALGQLLRGASSTGATVIFPKLLQPRRRNYPETLAEVGQSITPTGRRVGTVDEGDIDQGQEISQPILGGSTAGMLIRGDIWHQLGGLAPELPLHRDGVDFGWRANEAGHGVITWPDAALTHRQSGRTGERRGAFARESHEVDRLAALRVVAARGPKPSKTARLVVGSVLRSLGFLLAKSPRLAGAELRAARRFIATRDQVAHLAARSVDRIDVSHLLPSRHWPVRNALDRLGADMADRYRDFTSQESGFSIDEMTGDDFAGGPTRRRFLAPLSILTLLLIVAGGVALRGLFGLGDVFGGGLLPAPATLGKAWELALSPVAGAAGADAPWLSIGAFLSTLAFGSPQLLVFLALGLAPLLAALSAHSFLRRCGVTLTTSAIASGVWAGAVILLGLVTAGDIAGMVLAIVLPQLASAIHRIAIDDSTGAERLRAPASAAGWLLVGAAAWPVLLPLGLVGGIIWVIRDRHVWLPVMIAIVLPAAFLAPWFPSLFSHPGRILTGPDPLAWPAWPPASLATLFGRILPSGLPQWANIAFFAVLGLAAGYAICTLRSTRYRMVAIAGIGVPLVIGVVLSRIALPVNGGEARALLSGWALLTVAGLLAPVIAMRLRDEQARLDLRVLLSGLTAASLLAAGVWAVMGFAGPVSNHPSQLGYVHDVIVSARQTRVLMIEAKSDGGLKWNVADSSQPTWGTAERNPVGAFYDDFAALVQLFGGGDTPEDLADRLKALGVGHVWMKGFSAEQLAAVGNAAGLTSAPLDQDVVIWTVVELPARARIIDGESSQAVLEGYVSASGAERRLVLAEPPDDRWRASIGGQELSRISGDENVSFTVPAGAEGQLSWQLAPSWGTFGLQIGVVVLIAGLAAPTIGGSSAARRGLEE